MNKCVGGCESHGGEVLDVHVVDPRSGFDWGWFSYCENAIRIDIERGFNLTYKDESCGSGEDI